MHAQTAKLIARISENLPDISEDAMQCWIENPLGLKKALLVLCPAEEVGDQKAAKDTDRPSYKLLVNYDQTLAEMIAAGRYDGVNSDITAEHFPVTGRVQEELEFELFHFNRVMSSDAVLEELDKAGYRPAKIEALLALGAKHPNLQREFPIIALASPWQGSDGHRSVPYLGEWRGERGLGLLWFELEWFERYRFPAVRK